MGKSLFKKEVFSKRLRIDRNTRQDWSVFLDVSVIWFRVEVNTFQTGESSVNRRGSTPVSTVLRKSVTFFITNIFLIIKILSRLESGQYPVWMTMKSRKGDFKEWKSKKFPGGARLRTPLEACAFGARLGNRSVFILDPRLVKAGAYAPGQGQRGPIAHCVP